MAGASVRIEVDDADIAAGLRRLVEAGADLRPAMSEIADALLFSTQRRFETQSGPDGQRWSPFARSTLRRMPARRMPPQLLRDTARLYGSLTVAADDRSAEVGTNVVYAAIHQFGGEIPMPEREGSATFRLATQGAGQTKDGRRVGSRLRFAKASSRAKSKHTRSFVVPAYMLRIPARPYLGVSEADKAEILAILADHLAQHGGAEGAP